MYKGKSILVYLLVMASMLSYSQNPIVNKFRDSTWFAKGVRFDSAIYLIKGASNGKVLTSDASGRATWQTFSASGVSQGTLNDSINAVRSIRKVDTLYRNLDSLVFKINGIRYAIKDSSGGGVTQQALNDSIARLDSTINTLQTSLNDTANVLRGLIPEVSTYATITNLKDSTSLLRSLIPQTPTFSLSKNSAKDSIVTVFNGTRSAVKDSIANLTNYVTNTTLTDSLAEKTNKLISFNAYTTSDTLRLTDADKVIEMNVGTANNLVIPTNTAYAFPVGTQIVLIQIGAGQTTFVPASGVTVHSSGSKLKLTGQYSGATIIKKATNEWYLFGDITN